MTDLKKEVREKTARHCHELYNGILSPEIVEGTIAYWNERTDELVDTIARRVVE